MPPAFVLVHGAWAGAHGFRKLRPLLTAEGYEVFTPSLTGIGERVHLTGPQVDLTTHVTDVVNQVLYEDLDKIVLLGFSYGGMVVTGALEHIADRVRHLVYLDAFVPADGESVASLTGGQSGRSIELGAGWQVDGPSRAYEHEGDAEWFGARRVAQPARCFTEPVRLERPLEEFPFTRTYVKAAADEPGAPGNPAFLTAAEHARESAAWDYREIDTTHLVPINRPGELAAILFGLA